MPIVDLKNVTFEYIRRDNEGNVDGITTAIDGVSLKVAPGEFIAVLGANGSGKSTLAKHINALLFPTEGAVYVDGINTADEDKLLDIRSTAGMIFQNPDDQIIGQIVEEDVAFGPENLGVPTEEIRERVYDSLSSVGMSEYGLRSPDRLSGGQKQRISIASVIAMKPKCIIMDEPTAMIDPEGRREILETAHRLNKEEKITVILITHYMEEVVDADRVFVMDKGKVAMSGTPAEIFSRVSELQELRLTVPQATELAHKLKMAGVPIREGILNGDELVNVLMKMWPGAK